MSAQFHRLLPLLVHGNVKFILIGGVAGIVHGSARLTYAIDMVYDRAQANLKRLVDARAPGPSARQ